MDHARDTFAQRPVVGDPSPGILLTITDGIGEGAALRAVRTSIQLKQGGDGDDFRPRARTDFRQELEKESELRVAYEAYRRSLDTYFFEGYLGIGLAVPAEGSYGALDPVTLRELTTDAVEAIEDLGVQIERLIECLV